MAHGSARRTLDYVLAAALLAIPALLVHAKLEDPSDRNVVDRVVLRLASPLQRGVGWIVDGVAAGWHRYVWLVDVEEENEELRRENVRLQHKVADAVRQAQEAAALEALVELRARMPSDTVGARVIAVGTSPSFRITRLVLDRGEGVVSPGMPVVAPEGVVGRIARVYGPYADVILAVDPQSSIDVVVARTGARGVLKGLGSDNGYACKIDYLVRNDEVKVDDLVVTSGLGAVFPKDLAVGRIAKISKTEYGLYQDVEVRPAVDFGRLSSVLVILSPPPPPDPTARTKKSPRPAFGAAPVR